MIFMAFYDGSSMDSIDVDRRRIDAYRNGNKVTTLLLLATTDLRSNTIEYDRRR